MATLTISVDPEVLRRARIRALERNESVNKYLSDQLERYANARGREVMDAFLALAAQHDGVGGDGPHSWAREDLYDV